MAYPDYSNPLWWLTGQQQPTQPKPKIVSWVPPAAASTAQRKTGSRPVQYSVALASNYQARPGEYRPAPIKSQFGYVPNIVANAPWMWAQNQSQKPVQKSYALTGNNPHYTPPLGGWTGPLLQFQNINTEGWGPPVRMYKNAQEAGLPPGGVPGIPEHYWNPYLDPILDAPMVQQYWSQAQQQANQTRAAQASGGYRGYGGGYGSYFRGYGGGGYGGGYSQAKPNMANWYSELINWSI